MVEGAVPGDGLADEARQEDREEEDRQAVVAEEAHRGLLVVQQADGDEVAEAGDDEHEVGDEHRALRTEARSRRACRRPGCGNPPRRCASRACLLAGTPCRRRAAPPRPRSSRPPRAAPGARTSLRCSTARGHGADSSFSSAWRASTLSHPQAARPHGRPRPRRSPRPRAHARAVARTPQPARASAANARGSAWRVARHLGSDYPQTGMTYAPDCGLTRRQGRWALRRPGAGGSRTSSPRDGWPWRWPRPWARRRDSAVRSFRAHRRP